MPRGKETTLYAQDPEFYGYEWNDRYGDYVRIEDDEVLYWEVEAFDAQHWGYQHILDNLPIEKNSYVVAGDKWIYSSVFEFLPDAIDYAVGSEDITLTEYDGDLYANGRMIRVLTDKGQEWYDNHAYPGSLNVEEAEHVLEVKSYTKKIRPTVKINKRKPFDSSKYYDPERHPLRNFPGNLYTIDRGFGSNEYRYVTARGNMGTDGLPGMLAHSVGNGPNSWDTLYDEGERLHETLKPGETRGIGNGVKVTRVRNAKPKKLIKSKTAKRPTARRK